MAFFLKKGAGPKGLNTTLYTSVKHLVWLQYRVMESMTSFYVHLSVQLKMAYIQNR